MIDITQEQIMKNWGVDNADTPLVSIRCITYNHEPYIAQALDGFLMQKTSFPFEIVVHDDASTDKTAEIIREYEKRFPKIVKPIYEIENQWSKPGNVLGKIVNAALKGKYVAYCEGDDYWIDENKLQIQVDFLENNKEYGLCYTSAQCYDNEIKKFGKVIGENSNGFYDLLQGNKIPTLTVCIKNDLLKQYHKVVDPSSKNWKMGDYPLWLYVSYISKIKYMNSISGIYRILPESASNTKNFTKKENFIISTYEIIDFFYKFANLTNESLPAKKNLHLSLLAFVYKEKEKGFSYLKKVKKCDLCDKKNLLKYYVLKNPLLRFLYVQRYKSI